MRERPGAIAVIARLTILIFLATATASLQQPAATQDAAGDRQKQPPPSGQPFRTEANYVRVDAYPTVNGSPVTDLRAEEFEILENGARQEIRAFEHVVISPAGPQTMRVEPNSVGAGLQMAANPRNRVFIIFLDISHVAVEGSHRIKEPLIRLIDRVLGPDDLVAVMTPEMSAAQITFGRKTEVIADMLRDRWSWGKRHSIVPHDPLELDYERCFPHRSQKDVVREMVARRRERMALDALHDLVRYVGGVREERKAILAITEGWVLYRPDSSLEKLRVINEVTGQTERIPGVDPIGVDGTGKLRVGGDRSRESDNASQTTCDKDRMYLASIDNDQYLRDLVDVANRNNASFYPIDTKGLAVFDAPLGPEPPPPLAVDAARLRQRVQVLRTLAESTDGMAVVETNDLEKGIRRIADDLTSYYLLGYYSTNTNMDGGYRRITVRVTRPGVDVRARRGYRAATREELDRARTTAAAPVPEHVKTTNAALARLSRIRGDQRFSLHAVPIRSAPNGPVTALWIAGEIQGPLQEFARGAAAQMDVGGTAGPASASIKAGERAFLVKVPVQSGDGQIDIRARLTAEGVTEPLQDAVRLDAASEQPLLFRRGLSTGNRVQPAADFRFSRTDRLRLELPVNDGVVPGTARLLDRNAQPLQMPVQVGEKTGEDGQRWITGDAILSALGAGDYLIELTVTTAGAERRILTPIRVTR